MNPLPFDNQKWAFVRIVTAPAFGLGNGPWTVQPMWNKRKLGFGFELLNCSRVALPAIGEATFQYRFGIIDDTQVGVKTADNVARRIAGLSWDPDLDKATAPDLAGYEVRIQAAPPVEADVTPSWRTIWWGQVEYQEDSMWSGAPYPVGVRTYRCLDGFARAKRWPLNRHSTYNGGSWFIDVKGHPGYNVGIDGRIIGNRDAAVLTDANASDRAHNPALVEIASVEGASTPYKLHAQQGVQAVLTWTVQQAIEDAVRKTRGFSEPLFSFNGTTELLGDVIAMPVRDGDNAWDFTARLCRRERGRGCVFVDWADDVSTPEGLLTVRLTIYPQTLDDITYTAPAAGGSPTPLPGATTEATTVTVDVIGDHRLVAEDTQLSDKFLHVADAVETTSELIQVLVTLSYYDGADVSISQRWTAGREATFAGLTPSKRIDDAWEAMWQLHGIPDAWSGQAENHNGGTAYYCDFACNDAGALITSGTENRRITSPILCKLLPDLPLYEGYNHAATPPIRKIGSQVAIDETGQPARRKPLVLIRTGDNRYLNGDNLAGTRSVRAHVRGRDILITEGGDLGNRYRIIGNTATSTLGSKYNLAQLGVTVGLELPHRIRRKTVRDGVLNPKRLINIRLPDLHLWLAHSGAIWDLDGSTKNATGYQALTGAAGASGATPGKLRDDRDALSRLHAMACAWYLSPRQTGKWTLRACGLLPSFETLGDDPGSATETVTYPVIGQLVTDFKASGQIATLNTPITAVHYDHQAGRTTWETDWQELDFI